MSGEPPARFPVYLTRGLKRRGLRGMPYVSSADGALIVDGGQQVRIPFGSVERAQIGFYAAGKREAYSAYLWIEGDAEPIEIRPFRSDPGFGAAMRALANVVVGRRGLGSVIGGMPFSRSLVSLLLMTVAAAAIGVQLAVVFRLGSWAYFVLPAIGAAIMTPLYREALNAAPRRINSLHELEAFLPQPPKA